MLPPVPPEDFEEHSQQTAASGAATTGITGRATTQSARYGSSSTALKSEAIARRADAHIARAALVHCGGTRRSWK